MNTQLMAMEDLFLKAGLDYKLMKKNISYDIRDKNVKIKSFNHKEEKTEFKKVLSLIRKDDSKVCYLVTASGDILLKCSLAHRIFDVVSKSYKHVGDIEGGVALNGSSKNVEFFVKRTEEIYPIVDLEVEDNQNYFTNGILSHNTTSGGEALPFYASIRCKFHPMAMIVDENKEGTARRTKVTVVKNKTAPPFKSCEFDIKFGTGFDESAMIIDEMFTMKIATRAGSWMSLLGERVGQGRDCIVKLVDDYKALDFFNDAIISLDKGGTLESVKKDWEKYKAKNPLPESELVEAEEGAEELSTKDLIKKIKKSKKDKNQENNDVEEFSDDGGEV